ncbi:MAG: DUF4147 domain-containing protein [Acidobacteriota bacterium]
MVGSEEGTLTRHHTPLRADALAIARAAIEAVDAGRLVTLALPFVYPVIERARRCVVVAAGKASASMLHALLGDVRAGVLDTVVQVAHVPTSGLPGHVEVFTGGHPVPNPGSIAAGRRALEAARSVGEDDLFLVLLSGGASALLAVPAEGLSLADKQTTTRRLLETGADIHMLNAVRKHLSQTKGGRLAAACQGRTLCLAVSDVVGDDLSVIGSGPTVADPSTYGDALAVLDRCGGREAFPAPAVAVLEDGLAGGRPESPKPGAPELARAETRVIGSRVAALTGARARAERLGHRVVVHAHDVVGEARTTAARHFELIRALDQSEPGPVCLLSAGETTVTVAGRGKGGRNQEFALALARPLASLRRDVVVASVGTDGIDGPTDAAGAVVDNATMARAARAGLDSPERFLADNDAYAFLAASGDLIITGPTDTNVGDVQIVLLGARDS